MRSIYVVTLMTVHSVAFAQSCPQNFGHLSSKLPNYNQDADLKKLRDMAMAAKPAETMQQTMSELGKTRQQVAVLFAQVAAQHQQALPTAEECVRASAADPDRLVQALRDGRYPLSGNSTAVNQNCAKGYILHYYSMVYHREMALALACLAK